MGVVMAVWVVMGAELKTAASSDTIPRALELLKVSDLPLNHIETPPI